MTITRERLNAGFTYEAYRQFMHDIVEGNAGKYQEVYQERIENIKKNDRLMKRLENKLSLRDRLVKVVRENEQHWIWLVLVEPWCGDVGQNLPVINALAQENDKIELHLLLRDENPDIMDRYLFNGTRSIPVLICLEKGTLNELGFWGPRPKPPIEIMRKHKEENDPPEKKQALIDIQHWYEKDKQQTIQLELKERIWQWQNH